MNIYSYGNSYVIDNQLKNVDINLLNKVIIRWLKESGDTTINDSMNRCREYKDYIIIAPYGALVYDSLKDFISNYMKATGLRCRFYDKLPDDLHKLLYKEVPTILLYKGSQCGGPTEDSKEIDLGVKPLCDVLNLFSDINTFSSCEGHNTDKNSSVMYVLFTIDGNNQFSVLNNLTSILDNAFEEIWRKMDIKQ